MKTNNVRQLVEALMLRKVSFLITFFIVFLASYAFLAWVDFLPEPVSPKTSEKKAVLETENDLNKPVIEAENEVKTSFVGNILPEKITFDSLDRSAIVLNPNSRSVADLDNALLNGVVRHPDSATLGQDGTLFILGHSSYLPKVVNENFQAFNGVQDLKWGDIIRVEGGDEMYVYRVEKVYKAKATDTTVPIAGDSKRLVLATCNSFGSTDDRYIVEAILSEVKTTGV
ncbi:MAG: sortase [Candidatus Pacebacteria bacterium]|nr:sortase [Candidatus Paceibacterota bacterium]